MILFYSVRIIKTLVLFFLLNAAFGSRFGVSGRYPVPKFAHSETNVTVNAGETAILVCKVKNLGTRKVIWRKPPDVSPLTIGRYVFVNDVSMSVEHARESEDWKLIISGAHSNHSGEYECQVPTADKQMRKQFYLTVIEKPHVHPQKSNSKEVINISDRQHVNTDEPFEIYCNATGVDFVPENIDWFKNGEKLQSNVGRGVSIKFSVTMETKTIKSTFRIEHARMSDAGTYTCRTSNSLVESTSVVVLYATRNNSKRGMINYGVLPPSPRSLTTRNLINYRINDLTTTLLVLEKLQNFLIDLSN
ncbi:hemicentin-2-like isoform X2 [Ostrea edulis]|uniref:hemicentin-2-like isoform X2 n=1 Tax=Ostrea edulis TaxID=37623 RepID=UPI0024AF9534|nr:hemicentin-2-like isoform X2 [Ostrea edulis]